MKKTLCILLAVLMIIGLFSGCAEKEPEPLRILVDAGEADRMDQTVKEVMKGFVDTIRMVGGPTDIEVEVLPASKYGTARETALTRIRTEIMSGKGPDVIIARCTMDNDLDPLFPVVEKTMNNDVFMPLDKYIENAQYMEWDKHTAVIMDAGRNRFGQVGIPMPYTLPLTHFRESDIEGVKPSAETTWEEMITDESGVLSVSATWKHYGKGEYFFRDSADNYIECVLGEIADYRKEKLLFTEEELLQRTLEVLKLERDYNDGKYDHVPAHYQTRMFSDYDNEDLPETVTPRFIRTEQTIKELRGVLYEDKQTMIPIYADDGGVTATVTSYAAINANTRRPEDAFLVLDLILSKGYQQSFDLYDNWLTVEGRGIPVHEDIMKKSTPSGQLGLFWLSNENYDEYDRVRQQIRYVQFEGGLSVVFDEMYAKCKTADAKGEDCAPIVAEYYNILKQMMAE